MSFAILANVLTMIFCTAVLVQSVRMMRSLRTVKDGALTDVVGALDKATAQARAVLSDMKVTLSTDCTQNARLISQARELRDELSDMIGIADAACERIVGAVGLANAQRPVAQESDEGDDMFDLDTLVEQAKAEVAAEATSVAEVENA